jgi:hypothetical protein
MRKSTSGAGSAKPKERRVIRIRNGVVVKRVEEIGQRLWEGESDIDPLVEIAALATLLVNVLTFGAGVDTSMSEDISIARAMTRGVGMIIESIREARS